LLSVNTGLGISPTAASGAASSDDEVFIVAHRCSSRRRSRAKPWMSPSMGSLLQPREAATGIGRKPAGGITLHVVLEKALRLRGSSALALEARSSEERRLPHWEIGEALGGEAIPRNCGIGLSGRLGALGEEHTRLRLLRT
jgi:hypothetical protein